MSTRIRLGAATHGNLGMSPSEGEILEPGLRAFFESRFGASFAGVRIHSDPETARICNALEARAFTLGDDVYFAQGHYAPATPAGKFLIAHELVHVLQQRAAATRAPAAARQLELGDPRDAFEAEADRLALEALGSGVQSPVTPDSTGLIRRQASFKEDTATLVPEYKGAIPGASLVTHQALQALCGTNKGVMLHLTKNKEDLIAGRRNDAWAVRFTGQVVAEAPSETDLKADWRFHFMQFFTLSQKFAYFAGAASSDGSMYLDFASPTYFAGAKKFSIDANPKALDPETGDLWPYMEDSDDIKVQTIKRGQFQVTVAYQDHPMAIMPRFLSNPAGNKRNYLIYFGYHYKVVTVFVAEDRNSHEIKPLCWVQWTSILSGGFQWRCKPGQTADDPETLKLESHNPIGMTQLYRGMPTDPKIQELIQSPPSAGSDTYNDRAQRATESILQAAKGKMNTPELRTLSAWDQSVAPADHFL